MIDLGGNANVNIYQDRFALLSVLVTKIPSDALHLLPVIVSEAVLGTKEVSEKARSAAFDLIVIMGKRMSEGGIVKRNLVDGMDEDDNPAEGKRLSS